MARTEDEIRRARQRASWPVRKVRLEDDPGDDLSECTTESERLDMMWQLAVDAWASAGRPMPTYARNEMPGRILRGVNAEPTDVE